MITKSKDKDKSVCIQSTPESKEHATNNSEMKKRDKNGVPMRHTNGKESKKGK